MNEMVEEAKSLISSEVENFWRIHKKPMLLSALGFIIRQKFQDNVHEIMPDGLRRFIIEWPVVCIVPHPDIPQKVGTLPLGVPIPEDPRTLFSDTSDSEIRRVDSRIYDQRFWDLFIYKRSDSRFIIIDDDSWDITSSISQDETRAIFEVYPSDVSSLPRETPLDIKIPAVHEKIDNWLKRNNLRYEIFLKKHSTKSIESSIIRNSERRLEYFSEALGRLEQCDLARIMVPLDIVKRMLER